MLFYYRCLGRLQSLIWSFCIYSFFYIFKLFSIDDTSNSLQWNILNIATLPILFFYTNLFVKNHFFISLTQIVYLNFIAEFCFILLLVLFITYTVSESIINLLPHLLFCSFSEVHGVFYIFCINNDEFCMLIFYS